MHSTSSAGVPPPPSSMVPFAPSVSADTLLAAIRPALRTLQRARAVGEGAASERLRRFRAAAPTSRSERERERERKLRGEGHSIVCDVEDSSVSAPRAASAEVIARSAAEIRNSRHIAVEVAGADARPRVPGRESTSRNWMHEALLSAAAASLARVAPALPAPVIVAAPASDAAKLCPPEVTRSEPERTLAAAAAEDYPALEQLALESPEVTIARLRRRLDAIDRCAAPAVAPFISMSQKATKPLSSAAGSTDVSPSLPSGAATAASALAAAAWIRQPAPPRAQSVTTQHPQIQQPSSLREADSFLDLGAAVRPRSSEALPPPLSRLVGPSMRHVSAQVSDLRMKNDGRRRARSRMLAGGAGRSRRHASDGGSTDSSSSSSRNEAVDIEAHSSSFSDEVSLSSSRSSSAPSRHRRKRRQKRQRRHQQGHQQRSEAVNPFPTSFPPLYTIPPCPVPLSVPQYLPLLPQQQQQPLQPPRS